MELMSRYEDNYFDLAIVDPPFGIGNFVQTNNRGKKVEWNDSAPSKKYFSELKRVSKNRIIFGANYYNCFEENGGAIVWVKNQPMPDFSKCVIASCSLHKKIEMYNQTWTNFVAKDRKGIHPCEMPVQLYEWILMTYAKEGDKILDTHLGSGSIAIAAHDLGCDLTACELDKEYYEAAIKRIAQHKSQLRLL
jgi:site-specific DNA-methyltransferase (adenine-specific)|tara:strand:+ start:311 stop:886 length:576 start_codon:yes stop_codon:yes gene_type:complete